MLNNQTMNNAGSLNIVALLRRLVLVGLIIAVLMKVAIPSWNNVMALKFNDNDDIMRILQVRAWLDGQGFYDIFNYRLNPPVGGDIHWSRLADIPLAINNLILRLFLDPIMAEKTAAFITPLMLALVFLFVAGKTANALFKSKISFFLGAIFAVATQASMNYFTPGRVDHHGLQLIFMLCGFWGLFAQDKKGGILAGLAIAASITIGFELITILVLMVGFVALRWGIRGQDTKVSTIYFSVSLLLGGYIGFLINVPPSEWQIAQNDALSIATILPISVGAIGLSLAAGFLSKMNWVWRFVILLLIAAAIIGCALQFPILLKPPYWQAGPLLQRLWIDVIAEVLPLIELETSIKLSLGLSSLILSVLVVGNLGFLVFKKNNSTSAAEFDNWLLIGLALVSVTLLTWFWQVRIAGQAGTIASFSAAALIAMVYHKFGIRLAIIITLLVNPFFPSIAAVAVNKIFPPKKEAFAVGGGANCKGPKSFAAIAAKPKGIIAAPIDFGAHALISTHHSVLAAPYHRNQGNLIAYNIFLATPENAKALLAKSNVDYVGICSKSAEVRNLAKESPNGLMAMLKAAKHPDYLKPIETPKGSDIIAFEVIK